MTKQAEFFGQSGEVLRDAGMQQAVTHANETTPGWSEGALKALIAFINRPAANSSFMAEEVRLWAHQEYGLPRPPHNRAWGSVILKAFRKNLIRKIGIEQVRNPIAHCANAGVWVKAY